MELVVVSFLAGVLTVAAPCVLPLLPVIVGGTVAGGQDAASDWRRPVVITASLVISVIAFTLLIRGTTALLGVPQIVWQAVSGIIVILLGLNFLKPELWDGLAGRLNLTGKAGALLARGNESGGVKGDIVLGAALGPAFNSCSPTYALILAAILPSSFAAGLGYLTAYAIGLGLALLLLAFAGRGLARRLGWLADPHGKVRRVIGLLLIVVGVAVIVGADREFQSFVLEQGWYDPIAEVEQGLGL